MNGTKQAALLLHGLDGRDAEWVLARLPEAEREALRAHLDELKELGIPADPSLGATLAGRHLPARQRVADAGAERVFRALEHEPAWLVAGLLSAGPWAWQGAFLARLGEARRQTVASVPARSLPPALQAALIDKVAARLDAVATASAPAAPQRQGGLAAWIRRWLP